MGVSPCNDEFLELFTQHQLRLYRYILMLMANRAEAEEVLQNTSLVLLQKWDHFQAGTSFWAWATRIAYFEILTHRKAQGRTRLRQCFSDATLEIMAAEVADEFSLLEQQSAALPGCMDKLSPDDLTLVTDHYFRGLSWEAIAARLGRTASSVRHSVCRIRRELRRCIDGVLEKGDV
jgi:RNA polymerase sigma-70 factor (ECF subfamily)